MSLHGRHILLTRSQPGAERQAQALRAEGAQVSIADCLHTRAVPWPLPQRPVDGVVVLSAAGVRFGLKQIAWDIPVYAVGQATAELARQAGFRQVMAPQTAHSQALAQLISQHCAQQQLLVLTGHAGQRDWLDALPQAGIEVHLREVYRREINMQASQNIDALMRVQEPDAVVIGSNAGASALQQLSGRHWHRLCHCAGVVHSQRGSQHLHELGWRGPIHIAATPGNAGQQTALLALFSQT